MVQKRSERRQFSILPQPNHNTSTPDISHRDGFTNGATDDSCQVRAKMRRQRVIPLCWVMSEEVACFYCFTWGTSCESDMQAINAVSYKVSRQ